MRTCALQPRAAQATLPASTLVDHQRKLTHLGAVAAGAEPVDPVGHIQLREFDKLLLQQHALREAGHHAFGLPGRRRTGQQLACVQLQLQSFHRGES